MLRLRPAARDDLDAAARWYEAQEPGLGSQFLAEVRLVFHRIRSNPAGYPASYRGTRRALIRRFPAALRPRPQALAAALQVLTATSSTALTAPSSRPASAPRATRSWWRQAPCRYAPAEVITTILSATEAETPTGRKSFAVLSKLTANA